MGTCSSIYWYKTGGIINIEKIHDSEGQANESKQNLIIYKIQARAHRDKLPKCLQSSEVLPVENKHGRRPVYTGCVRTQSSDLALVTQLLKPNWAVDGKRQVQYRNFQKRQIQSSAHWTWTALGRPHRSAVHSFLSYFCVEDIAAVNMKRMQTVGLLGRLYYHTRWDKSGFTAKGKPRLRTDMTDLCKCSSRLKSREGKKAPWAKYEVQISINQP